MLYIYLDSRHQQRTEFLNELKHGWSSLNTMHILLVYLQRAEPEERPVVAAILLQLDLLVRFENLVVFLSFLTNFEV